ncbi:endonuclease/exonuclease/phosphatase family protein [uncultured Jannaschia sp.]|uniref:endonuclease/exonuclease/phosphatase family protein n=1 Tax=uncultured Jannaschia sp. TaxID=293347 RepID=UPI0026033A82|nr:endonuclease/exonuclease/phosphatase family protein [uncultured Jannaschia sp.]
MLRDLVTGDEQAEAALAVIAAADADILLLLDVDWDHERRGAAALVAALAERGLSYPHAVALRPNSGAPSGIDLDGDGDAHGPRDALGYGWFTGDSGLLLLSNRPLGAPRDLSGMLWSARSDAVGVLPDAARDVVPLATTAQWTVPVTVGSTEMTLVTMAAGTPVFDGPEDRNGLRNRDELALVADLAAAAEMPLVLGRANLDPGRGEGRREAIDALLAHPRLQDPGPAAPDGTTATAIWDSVGPMRVDYVLPPRALTVADAGILRPGPDDPLATAAEDAGSGRLVWVDLVVP